MEDYFSMEWGWHGDGFRMIHAHYVYYALSFFLFFSSFIYLFLAVLGVCCCAGEATL